MKGSAEVFVGEEGCCDGGGFKGEGELIQIKWKRDAYANLYAKEKNYVYAFFKIEIYTFK